MPSAKNTKEEINILPSNFSGYRRHVHDSYAKQKKYWEPSEIELKMSKKELHNG